MILRNAQVLLPEGWKTGIDVVVEDGRISAIRDITTVDDVVDLAGAFLVPGFIDLHVHGALGRDTMEASAEALRVICDFHLTGGTTSLLLTTVTAPLEEVCGALATIRQTMPSLPQLRGAHLEGPFISPNKPGAQRVEFIRTPDEPALNRLLEYSDVIRLVTMAPEIEGAMAAIAQFTAHDVLVSGGHTDATDAEAAAAFGMGMTQTTHTFNCMSSARREGIYRIGGLLEFALGEPAISCELIADGHHVKPTLMRMLYQAKRAGGICLVTDATAGAGLPEGSEFRLGGLECIVDNGVCKLADHSALAGSASRMIDCVRTAVQGAGVPLEEALQMASANPARLLGLSSRKGVISGGADADFVVLSADLEVRRTYVAGCEVFTA